VRWGERGERRDTPINPQINQPIFEVLLVLGQVPSTGVPLDEGPVFRLLLLRQLQDILLEGLLLGFHFTNFGDDDPHIFSVLRFFLVWKILSPGLRLVSSRCPHGLLPVSSCPALLLPSSCPPLASSCPPPGLLGPTYCR
jgi:hypothetical protein